MKRVKGKITRVSHAWSVEEANIEFAAMRAREMSTPKNPVSASEYVNSLLTRERERLEKFKAVRAQLAQGRKAAEPVRDPYGGGQ